MRSGGYGSRHVWKRRAARAPVSLSKGVFETRRVPRGERRTSHVTFGELWERFVKLKSALYWEESTRQSITCQFAKHVLPRIGTVPVRGITLGTLMELLGALVEEGRSRSIVFHVRTYVKAVLEFAVDEGIIPMNPVRGRKLRLPRKGRRECREFLTMEQIQQLLSVARGRDRLILHLFIVAGLRPGEAYALREDDLPPEGGSLRIDEAIKQACKGRFARLGPTKTEAANDSVAISAALEEELRKWIARTRGNKRIIDLGAVSGAGSGTSPEGSPFIFQNKRGEPLRPNNVLRRHLKPLARRAGIPNLTYQMLRRTFATHAQSYGTAKDTQRQLRHTTLTMTGRYIQLLPESLQRAVEALDAKVSEKPPARTKLPAGNPHPEDVKQRALEASRRGASNRELATIIYNTDSPTRGQAGCAAKIVKYYELRTQQSKVPTQAASA